MTAVFRFASLAALLWLAAAGSLAHAADAAPFSRIDPNTFRIGHPASPTWRHAHAGHEHPAVVNARMAHQATINPDTFIVQPPASVRWTSASAGEPVQMAQAIAH